MYRDRVVGVVVPAYNEAGFIGTVLETIPEYVDRVYAVDDHSRDATWEEIVTTAAVVNTRMVLVESTATDGGVVMERIVPIRHDVNRGRGAAVKTGYRAALADGMDVIAVMDGDGQMDPDILHLILDPVVSGAADYAKGNRLVRNATTRGMTAWRLFGNLVLTGLTKVASGYWSMRDPQNGYTAISADALAEIGIEYLYDEYGFLNDVLVALNVHDKRIADVPMPARYGDEESGIRYSRFIPRLSLLLLARFIWRIRRKYLGRGIHPAAIAYVVAGVILAIGTVYGIGTLVGSSGTSSSFAASLLLIGMVSTVVAMFLDASASWNLVLRVDAPES